MTFDALDAHCSCQYDGLSEYAYDFPFFLALLGMIMRSSIPECIDILSREQEWSKDLAGQWSKVDRILSGVGAEWNER